MRQVISVLVLSTALACAAAPAVSAELRVAATDSVVPLEAVEAVLVRTRD